MKNKESKKEWYTSLIESIPAEVKIFCDGSVYPNPGEIGTGMVVYYQNQLHSMWYGMHESEGTNNVAELNGILMALKFASMYQWKKNRAAIFSDSMYSINCTIKWAEGWRSRKWTKQGGKIKNVELIKRIYDYHQAVKHYTSIHHVKGHCGIEGNELADQLSTKARLDKQKEFVLFEGILS